MLKDMYAVIGRISDIKTRFGLKKPNYAIAGEHSGGFEKTLNDNIQKINNAEQKKLNGNISVNEIKEIADSYAVKNGVPASLVNAVIKTESGFNPLAVSDKGAMGLMQLMPVVMKTFGVNDPFNIHENISGGVSFLKSLLEKYNWDYKKALAAYNAGEAAVDKSGGIPPIIETKEFVKKVIDSYMQNGEITK